MYKTGDVKSDDFILLHHFDIIFSSNLSNSFLDSKRALEFDDIVFTDKIRVCIFNIR